MGTWPLPSTARIYILLKHCEILPVNYYVTYYGYYVN